MFGKFVFASFLDEKKKFQDFYTTPHNNESFFLHSDWSMMKNLKEKGKKRAQLG